MSTDRPLTVAELVAREVHDFPRDVAALRVAMRADRAAGRLPLMVVGTAGTTGAGAIDPLPALADLCAAEGAWLHVDAAWGGTAALSPTLGARVVAGGRAWISELALRGESVLRACVTSYRTDESDLDALVRELAHALDGPVREPRANPAVHSCRGSRGDRFRTLAK